MRLLPLLVLASCLVPKRRYDALQAELDRRTLEHSAALAERDAHVASLAEALEETRRQAERLGQLLAHTEAAYASDRDVWAEQKVLLLKDKSRLRASVADMHLALRDLHDRKYAAEERVARYRDLLDRFAPLISEGRLDVKVVDGRMVVELPTDILFASGQADLAPEGVEALSAVADVLATIDDRTFRVEGHTDDVPIHTARFPSNWELGAARAIAVVRALIEAGVPAERLLAASLGDHRPVASNETEAGRSRNRRIEIVVVPDLEGLPGSDELDALSPR